MSSERGEGGGAAPAPPFHPGDMPGEEFRAAAHEVARFMADYLSAVEGYPVLSKVEPGAIRERLPEILPQRGEPFPEILRDFQELILPGVTHWNHPGFFAYFSITGSGPGILGEMLAAALNVNAMVWRTSPAATELEERTLAWVRELVGLPPAFAGVINDTASTSTLYALAAAREALLPGAGSRGLWGAPRGRFYASEQAHSSVDKAVLTLGFGREGLRKIPTDEAFRMRSAALGEAIREDQDGGFHPLGVVATLGTTSTTSVDPVAEVVEIAREHGLWVHVDAAYGGPAAALPELRPLFAGWEEADSIVLNPHKWLFTPIDCSALYLRDLEALRRAFSLTPEYLRTGEEGVARNLMDYGVALGRRFRSLKLWFVLRYFGREGIQERLREHLALARELAAWIDADPEWVRVAPVPFSTVVFRYAPAAMPPEAADEANQAIMDRVNATGEVFLSHTVLEERRCLRVALGNLRTTRTHLARCWELLQEAAAAL